MYGYFLLINESTCVLLIVTNPENNLKNRLSTTLTFSEVKAVITVNMKSILERLCQRALCLMQ